MVNVPLKHLNKLDHAVYHVKIAIYTFSFEAVCHFSYVIFSVIIIKKYSRLGKIVNMARGTLV